MTVAALRPPDGRQGPGPMPGALLRMLDLALVRRAGGTLPGDHLAPGAGAGTELVQLRPYQVGDDVRQIDAAATARTGVPHVRLQVPERTLTTWLVIDVSPSMAFGTARRLKADVAEGVAIAVARLATRRGGRAGLLRAGAGDELLLPPRGGRHAQLAIERAVREGVAADAAASPDALSRALVRAGRVARRPGLVVVVSDFREEGWRAPLAALGARHSVVAVEVCDPREAALPSAGHLALVDPETGALVEVDSSRARVRERYAALEAERRESVAAGLRAAGADHVVLDTGHDWLRALGRGFDKRRVTRRPARRRPPRARPRGGRAMSFAAPLFLLALFALPVGAALHVLAQRRRRRYAVRFPGAPLAALAAPAAPRWRRHLPAALLATGAAALAVALARPEATVAVPVEQASVILVTDTSRSMTATDVAPDRLSAARSAAERFLDEAPDELRVGAVAFSDSSYVLQPPTTDHEQVRAALAGLVADGGTATGDGLDAALQALEPEEGDRRPPAAVVLLSDGKQTTGRDATEVAQEAGRLKVPVYTVALGTPDGVVDGILRVPPDPAALAEIARASGGQAFEASDADQLTAVYERLGSQLGTREETREITAAFAGAGILLLGGALIGSVSGFGRLP